MNKIEKAVFKLVLPFVVKFFVNQAEKFYDEAKAGDKKKEFVVETIKEFCLLMGWTDYLDFGKLSNLIEEKVKELINKA